jgi:thiol-disulfide isomerase/thioredoxin
MCLRKPMLRGLTLLGTGVFLSLFTLPFFPSAHAAGGPARSAFDLTGKPVDPFRASQGKIVVLLFVRTNCPVSNRYTPTIQRLSETFAGKAKFWLVYPDKSETAQEIRTHDQDYHYLLSALRDPDHILVKEAQASITPEAAVFTPSGQLVYHGRIDNWFVDMTRARHAPTTHELADAIEAAVQGKPPAVSTAQAVGCYISDLD